MAVQAFKSIDTGFAALLGNTNFETAGLYCALVAHGATITQAGTTYGDIDASPTDIVAVVDLTGMSPGPSVTVSSLKVQFDHDKVVFTSDGSLSGRYVVYFIGTINSPPSGNAADEAFGWVDLTGADENASSVDAEFSFDPHDGNGLFEVARAAAA